MTLSRSGRLRPISKKRLEELHAAGVYPTSTFAPKLTTDGRLPALSRSSSMGPDWNTVESVLERDSWSCVVCGCGIFGERGWDWSIGHRRPRRDGGDPRPETNRTGNLVTLHGSGTTGCHGVVESLRTESYALGWLLHAEDIPDRCPMQHALHGLVLLNDVGGWRAAKT